MASYRARANAIHDVVVQTRSLLELWVDGSPADKMVLIETSVEVVNKLLYCFMISQEMFDQIDRLLNDHLDVTADPQQIAVLYLRVLDVTRQLEGLARTWVVKYA